jgi:ketosteroid isomerase-like protein
MTHDDVQLWLDRYIEAWRSNDAQQIGELFSVDATYRYHAYAPDYEVLHGRDAIVASWLETPDDPSSWDAHYEPFAVDGDRAVATGTSRYRASGEQPERTFWNCYLLRFDADGRCAEFTEYYMRPPEQVARVAR